MILKGAREVECRKIRQVCRGVFLMDHCRLPFKLPLSSIRCDAFQLLIMLRAISDYDNESS